MRFTPLETPELATAVPVTEVHEPFTLEMPITMVVIALIFAIGAYAMHRKWKHREGIKYNPLADRQNGPSEDQNQGIIEFKREEEVKKEEDEPETFVVEPIEANTSFGHGRPIEKVKVMEDEAEEFTISDYAFEYA